MIARFISADSVVPGNASGGMDGVALKGLTVDFHEPGFVGQIAGENNQPFWFQMSGQQRQQAGSPWEPANPQALNRYSYVLNNPMGATDPSGHALSLDKAQAGKLLNALNQAISVLESARSTDTGLLAAQWNLAMTELGFFLSATAGVVMNVASSFFSPDFSGTDPNGNLEGLNALRELQQVTTEFYNNAPEDAKLTLWVTSTTRNERTGSSACNGVSCHYPTKPVTRYSVGATWGGKLRMYRAISKALYENYAVTTNLRNQEQPRSGYR